ncbi:MAG: CvpA family protein [Bacteroidia bacterium]|nr:CvpA family protein [Bacteroidia bacterium]
MNFIDILIIIPVLWGFWRGFMKGVVMEVATLVAFFLGVWGGMKFSDLIAGYIREWFTTESPYVPLIAFGLVFVAILIAVFALARFIDKSMEKSTLTIFNKLAGGAFGGFKFLLILSVLFFVVDAVEKSVTVIPPEIKDNSLLYRPVASVAPKVIPGLRDSDLGKMIPDKDDVEVGVDVNVKLKEDSLQEKQ